MLKNDIVGGEKKKKKRDYESNESKREVMQFYPSPSWHCCMNGGVAILAVTCH